VAEEFHRLILILILSQVLGAETTQTILALLDASMLKIQIVLIAETTYCRDPITKAY